MNKFDKLHSEIIEIIANSPIEEDPSHSEQVWKFILELDQTASEELQIAALAHDIERAVAPRTGHKKNESYINYKQRHAKRSADITAELLSEHGYSSKSIAKVKKLIEDHEIGGNRETDRLRDADSVSYFADNIKTYLKRNGENKTKEKIEVMYNRASNKSKELIRSQKYPDDVKRLIKSVIN